MTDNQEVGLQGGPCDGRTFSVPPGISALDFPVWMSPWPQICTYRPTADREVWAYEEAASWKRHHEIEVNIASAAEREAKPPSERELRILGLLIDGAENTHIAAELHYSLRTVKSVIRGLCVRSGAKNRTHLVSIALREGWL